MRYYVLNSNKRWQRVFIADYNKFTFKDKPNEIEHFKNYQVKVKYKQKSGWSKLCNI